MTQETNLIGDGCLDHLSDVMRATEVFYTEVMCCSAVENYCC